MVAANGEEAGIFALAAGVGLQRYRVEAGDLGQPCLELVEHRGVAFHVRRRGERMQAAHRRPAHRHHLGCRVELHRAGAERDHGAVERKVLVGQPAQEAHHLGFGAILVEDRLGQETVAAGLARQRRLCIVGYRRTEQCRQRRQVLLRRCFVERYRDPIRIDHPNDAAPGFGFLGKASRIAADSDGHRVEKAVAGRAEARLCDRRGEPRRETVDTPGDRLKALRSVPDRVGGRHVGEQRLRGADVRRCLVAADMLLAGLQCEAVAGTSVRVDGLADETAGHQPRQPVAYRAIGGMRSAIAHRHAEALHRPDGDLRAQRSRRLGQGQRQRVGDEDDDRAVRLRFFDRIAEIAVDAERVGPRHQQGRGLVVAFALGDLDAERFGARAHNVHRLGM